jgi:hypothetical protein
VQTFFSLGEGGTTPTDHYYRPPTAEANMSSSTVLITDMAILVGIFLLGLLAKLFPKKAGNRDEGTGIRADRSVQR